MLTKTVHMAILALVLLSQAGPVEMAQGAAQNPGGIIMVNTTEDDFTPNGNCSLREAVAAANQDAPIDECPAGLGADIIVLPAGSYVLTTLEGQSSALMIEGDTLFQGVSITDTVVTGPADEYAFNFTSGQSAIYNLTIQGAGGGVANEGNLHLEGIRITGCEMWESAGGFLNHGEATVVNSEFSSNTSWQSGGGGIANFGAMQIEGSEILGNGAAGSAGILNVGDLTMLDSRISGNSTMRGVGGGLTTSDYEVDGELIRRGTAMLIRTTIEHNEAYRGGGIYGSNITLVDSVVANNLATVSGGIYALGVTVINSTISGNTAEQAGGGVGSWGGIFLDHVTITGNATSDPNQGGGGIWMVSSTLQITNSIVAGNNAGISAQPDCWMDRDLGGIGIVGLHGSSVIGIQDGCDWESGPGDLLGTSDAPLDPLLGPLGDHGGTTQTHALLPGSPAVDIADPAVCRPADQRGIPRPQGPACDAGAFELEIGARIVQIDIWPRSESNKVICTVPNFVIPVAILTTADFDAVTVDHETVRFERAAELHRRNGKAVRHEVDVDRDGDKDLLFFFRLGDTSLTCASSNGMLTGETFDGEAIQGTDRLMMWNIGFGK